ncbi:MAG: hypothetical protein VW338_03450 [Rhodospirillaceae bacterium]
MITIVGYPGVSEQDAEREFSPSVGWQTIRTWHGEKAAIEGMLPQFSAFGVRLRTFKVDPAFHGLQAFFPDAQDGTSPADPDAKMNIVWELHGNDLNKSIFTHPKFQAIASKADQETLKKFSRGQLNYTEQAVQDLTGDAALFREEIHKGVQAYSVAQYVLRRNANVPLAWNGSVAMTDVGKVYATTGDLKTKEGVPNTLFYTLPDGEWLKRAPQIRQQRDGSWNIVNEWWHADDASDLLYEVITV